MNQAIILAGGRGERLRPFTDSSPKPMYPFHGKPFLAYLIESLVGQGVKKVLLLTGYRSEMIRRYFGYGDRYGVTIDYSYLPPEADTATRMRHAAKKLDETFLLMYCDNYWPLRLKEMLSQFETSGADAQLTIYDNRDGYTRDNVRVNVMGMIEQYDKSRKADDLQGVDIGYALMRRDVILPLLPTDNVSFEATVYPALVAKGKLGAYITGHRYYSAGSPERLPLTESFLRFRPAAILDRDGVLNVRPPQADYVKKWEEFRWLPKSREAVALLTKKGYTLFVVTNQPGIARSMMCEADLADIHRHMVRDIEEVGGRIEKIYHCPHGWDEGCACRKPAPGMLFATQRDYHLDLTKTPFIGDDERDKKAGEAAGCIAYLLAEGESLFDVVTGKQFGA